MGEGPTLRIEAVSLAFGGLRVLDGVSFAAQPGELFALIGPNGTGKTSVLNCVCGIYRARSDRIEFDERNITRESPHRIARISIARTFQHGELFPHMSMLENLLVARHARIFTALLAEDLFLPEVRAAEIEHRRAVEKMLEFVELERYRHAPVD